MILRLRMLLFFCSLLSLSACGSLSTRPPSVAYQALAQTIAPDGTTSPQASGLTWTLENLKPVETTVLIEGTTAPVSIELKLSGPTSSNNKYLLQFSTPKNHFHPFSIETAGVGGELDFSGTVTWFLDVSGISETITMALYRVDRSESGRTVTKTLVKDITRTYQVICNEDDFFLLLALKRLFCLCEHRSLGAPCAI